VQQQTSAPYVPAAFRGEINRTLAASAFRCPARRMMTGTAVLPVSYCADSVGPPAISIPYKPRLPSSAWSLSRRCPCSCSSPYVLSTVHGKGHASLERNIPGPYGLSTIPFSLSVAGHDVIRTNPLPLVVEAARRHRPPQTQARAQSRI
jgi:hypothetical protein